MPPIAEHIKIADQIVADVRSGKVQPGDKLPSIAEMAKIYGVSTSTIQMVNVRLLALRVIWRHQGKGIYINDPDLWMREPPPKRQPGRA
ncbi:MAG TPA: winged helix-turn-helix domain-containing protein [Micromonospora sp.]|nr:winged helix-turn-helix domain-containing protein [Micromonospora sp.]